MSFHYGCSGNVTKDNELGLLGLDLFPSDTGLDRLPPFQYQLTWNESLYHFGLAFHDSLSTYPSQTCEAHSASSVFFDLFFGCITTIRTLKVILCFDNFQSRAVKSPTTIPDHQPAYGIHPSGMKNRQLFLVKGFNKLNVGPSKSALRAIFFTELLYVLAYAFALLCSSAPGKSFGGNGPYASGVAGLSLFWNRLIPRRGRHIGNVERCQCPPYRQSFPSSVEMSLRLFQSLRRRSLDVVWRARCLSDSLGFCSFGHQLFGGGLADPDAAEFRISSLFVFYPCVFKNFKEKQSSSFVPSISYQQRRTWDPNKAKTSAEERCGVFVASVFDLVEDVYGAAVSVSLSVRLISSFDQGMRLLVLLFTMAFPLLTIHAVLGVASDTGSLIVTPPKVPDLCRQKGQDLTYAWKVSLSEEELAWFV
ncbi:hypothetical protein Tco_1568633 [Tanacetum coccineum]